MTVDTFRLPPPPPYVPPPPYHDFVNSQSYGAPLPAHSVDALTLQVAQAAMLVGQRDQEKPNRVVHNPYAPVVLATPSPTAAMLSFAPVFPAAALSAGSPRFLPPNHLPKGLLPMILPIDVWMDRARPPVLRSLLRVYFPPCLTEPLILTRDMREYLKVPFGKIDQELCKFYPCKLYHLSEGVKWISWTRKVSLQIQVPGVSSLCSLQYQYLWEKIVPEISNLSPNDQMFAALSFASSLIALYGWSPESSFQPLQDHRPHAKEFLVELKSFVNKLLAERGSECDSRIVSMWQGRSWRCTLVLGAFHKNRFDPSVLEECSNMWGEVQRESLNRKIAISSESLLNRIQDLYRQEDKENTVKAIEYFLESIKREQEQPGGCTEERKRILKGSQRHAFDKFPSVCKLLDNNRSKPEWLAIRELLRVQES